MAGHHLLWIGAPSVSRVRQSHHVTTRRKTGPSRSSEIRSRSPRRPASSPGSTPPTGPATPPSGCTPRPASSPRPVAPAPGRPRRPRPGTHLAPDRRPPQHHRRHRGTPLPRKAMIHLTRITGIMPLCVSCTAERAFYALGKARKAPATSCPSASAHIQDEALQSCPHARRGRAGPYSPGGSGRLWRGGAAGADRAVGGMDVPARPPGCPDQDPGR